MPDPLKPSPLPSTPRPTNMMPMFAQPPPPSADPAPASDGPGEQLPILPPTHRPGLGQALRERLSIRKPDPDDTSTGIYSPRTEDKPGGVGNKPSPAETAEVIAGILGLVVLTVAFFVDQRGRKLRKPTSGEYDAISTPIARIVLRHAEGEWLHPDLVDVLVAGNAVGAYVNSGEPLVTYSRVADDGVPANLQEDPK